jgi:hypothetical protein
MRFTLVLLEISLLSGCHQSQGLWTEGVYVPAPAHTRLTHAYRVHGEICGTVGQDDVTKRWVAFVNQDSIQVEDDFDAAKKSVEKACD